MFCANCGNKNNEGSSFCAACGNTIQNHTVNNNITNKPQKKSKLVKIIIFCIIGFFVFQIASFLFWIFIGTPAPPTPEITYGEFPFRIEYEIDGERFVFEDVLIAEFISSSGGDLMSGAKRIWHTRLDSEGEKGHDQSQSYDINKFLITKNEVDDLTIKFNPGLAQYYMGDPCSGESRKKSYRENPPISIGPSITIRTVNEGKVNVEYFRREDAFEVLAKHGITLISWETTKPIINSFKK